MVEIVESQASQCLVRYCRVCILGSGGNRMAVIFQHCWQVTESVSVRHAVRQVFSGRVASIAPSGSEALFLRAKALTDSDRNFA